MNSPLEVTNYKRSQAELEAFWIFCLFVAGKNSDIAFNCMRKFIKSIDEDGKTPFERLREEHAFNVHFIHNTLVSNKVGQYTRLERALIESLNVDLRSCELDTLLSIHGVGPKTARFFLVHSRGELDFAILDTHILKWVRLFYPDAPKATPTSAKVYAFWEAKYLELARLKFPQAKDAAEIDLLVWASMSGRI